MRINVWVELWRILFLLGLFEMGMGHESSLQLVVIIHRHGARGLLLKDPYNLSEAGEDPALLPRGAQEMKEVGERFRQRYLAENASVHFESQVNDSLVLAFSSNLKRTLATADAFLAGMFGDQATIPIEVFGDDAHDYLIRGYTKSYKFDQGLKEFYSSNVYLNLSSQTKEFRQRFNNTDLNDFFDTYDRCVLEYYYNVSSGCGVSSADLMIMTKIIGMLEQARYGREWGAVTATSALVSKVIGILENFNPSVPSARVIEFSAHYPTLISFLSGLKINTSSPVMTKFPNFGAAVSIELYQNDTVYGLRFFSLPGKDAEFEELYVDDFPGTSVPLDSFLNITKSSGLSSTLQDWCTANLNSGTALCPSSSPVPAGYLLGGIAIGTVVSCLILFLLVLLRRRGRKRLHKGLSRDVVDEPDLRT